jgi:hypothetical protein
MATRRRSILGWNMKPDNSGDVTVQPLSLLATNDVWDHHVVVFGDTATRIGLHGAFQVPEDYVGGGKFVAEWSAAQTSGDVVIEVDYRAVGGNDAESLDQAGTQESLTVTDTAPSAAWERMEAELAATAGNFAANDICQFTVFRDGTAADTLAGNLVLTNLFFEYQDA